MYLVALLKMVYRLTGAFTITSPSKNHRPENVLRETYVHIKFWVLKTKRRFAEENLSAGG
jgi:hypothetical protein